MQKSVLRVNECRAFSASECQGVKAVFQSAVHPSWENKVFHFSWLFSGA